MAWEAPARDTWGMAQADPAFTAAELLLIRKALLEARVILEAADGATLHHPRHGLAEQLDLRDELVQLEAALLLVTSG